ncbi:uncharacterized protein CANTADRAFT_90413 [Suhomyces tanzawaensis NRRL Y-17324]|uniref:Uncharacterized protein n=1 Tax=Suhomyces tanzawaensis NRRL Y-17324 TaxID=984487 RepID=A0A1E4SII6_9ASCO|nr:uncharacterized protein CANTADRAFT_90413 [Suhomyces tanzawaensis NRRL Y-17324]ODV79323.1 hypothetical protein CANTADRAFT_90413 [Suhomyces tanzawaensis NRRL Y-17324]
MAKSPSISSISSTGSNNSTDNLLKKLGAQSAAAVPPENGVETSQTTPRLPLSPTSINSGDKKKPIKFTVRKVSHEPIQSPTLGAGSKTKGTDVKEHDRDKLELAQAKYDHCVNKINKIDKEIDFLTKLLPPYNVEIDYATRTKITKAIEKLRMRQDEIEKKKYSLGITISRLWRVHDDSDIWVRQCSKQ